MNNPSKKQALKKPKSRIKRVGIFILSIVVLLVLLVLIFMQQPQFGKLPSGKRLERIQHSPNFKNGQFQNRSVTPTLAEGYSFLGELYKQAVGSYPNRFPLASIPSVKTDLRDLPTDKNILVWFGHSSCFIQLSGKTFLIDPIFSGNASPIPGSVEAFPGTDIYTVADLPDIDFLLISHDHYDHLDYETILALKEKTKTVICGLGVGENFEYWGYPADKIQEKDWYESTIVDSNFSITAEPARHQSGRGLIQNKTLWISFLIKSPQTSIYISGDGGYDTHLAEIGRKNGPIDLAILENGQYDSAWHYLHHLPVEVLQAARDLNAKRVFPFHSSKFSLARHPWDGPLKKITEIDTGSIVPLVTPRIGEPVYLGDLKQKFSPWWKEIKK